MSILVTGAGFIGSNLVEALLADGEEVVVLDNMHTGSPANLAGEAAMERPSKKQLLDLARYLRDALEKNGLDRAAALTGCYRCTGCDLIPGQDL
jgi:nucleoside-diphosphate-sugar epimerase